MKHLRNSLFDKILLFKSLQGVQTYRNTSIENTLNGLRYEHYTPSKYIVIFCFVFIRDGNISPHFERRLKQTSNVFNINFYLGDI